MQSFLNHALALASFGYRVFPLAPGQSVPALPQDWKKIATTDEAVIRGWWIDPVMKVEQPYNIGIACGRGLMVVDIDVKDGTPLDQRLCGLELMLADIPDTYWVDTPSGGRHYYLRVDPSIDIPNSIKKIYPHVDIKSDDGYVAARGSERPDGVYRGCGSPGNVADAPLAFIEAARRAKPAKAKTASGVAYDVDQASAEQRAIAWLESAEPAVEGDGGDNHTIVIANRVLDFGLSPDHAAEILDEHWNGRCAPPWDPGELKDKVANAAKSRQNPIGIAAPEVEFEAVEVEDRRSKPPRAKLYYERWRDAALSKGAPYLIKGWYDCGAMVVTYGESNSGKTNVVLSQAFAIATGETWAESRVRPGLVVYVAAEGGNGLRKRIAAYHLKYGKSDIPFALVPCPVDLLRPAGDTKALIELVKQAEVDFGQKCVMVVLDTLSRVLAGGNENAPDDMGALVIHCDRIREATKSTVHLIHHSGKNTAAGARGHSSLRAATDTEIEVAANGVAGKKQRDMEMPRGLVFDYEKVTLGTDTDGDPIVSVITHVRRETEFESRVSPAAQALFDALLGIESEADKQDILRFGTKWTTWYKAAIGDTNGAKSATNGLLHLPSSRQGLARLCKQLQDAGLVRKTKSGQWVSSEVQQAQQVQ